MFQGSKKRDKTKSIGKVLVLLVIVIISAAGVAGAYSITRMGPACQPSVQGYYLQIHVLRDLTGAPISGATVSIVRIDDCENLQGSIFATVTTPFPQAETPANGTLLIVSPPAGDYSISVVYSSQTYNAEFSVAPLNMTTVVMSIPSGRIEVTNTQPS